MADGVKIEIVSPEYLVLSAEAKSVTVPGAEGYFTVMGPHAPLMSTLRPGFVTVVDPAGAETRYFVLGGFADVNNGGLTILAEQARPASEFGRTEIEARITAAQEALNKAEGVDEKMAAQAELDQWKNLLLEATSTGVAH
ncbi:F0F1 ATP synthase subunit epsilon [Pelagibacterium montanilacus]|uniref:F0F1 ATP synthase subunit epsilon n=1 Tax=Pelagibacterium montanilacus TaxID=2185280 RepID=UPI000F8D5D20|nr:F0F1 ATP synthase subunit epsilon [Pelagibacterium montanilacus]